MPIISRLDWIGRQIEMGRMAHVVISQALDPKKLKIKFILHPPASGAISPSTCYGVTAVIGWIRGLVQNFVAMDRGHKHSSGISVVAIWLDLTQPGNSEQLLPPPPPPPTLPMSRGSDSNNTGPAAADADADDAVDDAALLEKSEREENHIQRVSTVAAAGSPIGSSPVLGTFLEDQTDVLWSTIVASLDEIFKDVRGTCPNVYKKAIHVCSQGGPVAVETVEIIFHTMQDLLTTTLRSKIDIRSVIGNHARNPALLAPVSAVFELCLEAEVDKMISFTRQASEMRQDSVSSSPSPSTIAPLTQGGMAQPRNRTRRH